MSNVTINMTIDRHRSGNSRIHGKVGAQFHDVNVWKGPEPGDCYIEGQQNGATTTLRFNSAFSDHGQAIFGRLAGAQFRGNWEQEAQEGDVEMSLNKARLSIDQSPDGLQTECKGTQIQSSTEKTAADGDETLSLMAEGKRVQLSVDRDTQGDFEIRGRSGDGTFRLKMERRGQDGDLHIKGTIPENLAMLPVVWELFGDDSLEPPTKPLSMGAAATLSAFLASHLND